ncbi:unnamed protein product [Urochloa humidicola]
MALRSLARGTWGPAAGALRCRSGAGMPAAAPARSLVTTRNQVKQHRNRTLKETADEEAVIMKEVDKVFEALSQHSKEMERLGGEMRRVVKVFAVSSGGISAYSLYWRWSNGEFTQPAPQGTSH